MGKSIALTGSSGFIGSEIIHYFMSQGDRIFPIKREILEDKRKLDHVVHEADTVINLAGAPILARWTAKKKSEILNSRVFTTKQVVAAINRSEKPPSHFISASAIGLYDGIHEHTEESQHVKNDFLAEIVQRWEEEAKKIEHTNTKVIILRLGIVLGSGGGMMKKILPITRLGMGATLCSGKQHFPFVHIDDVVGAINHVLLSHKSTGIYNVTAPGSATNKSFTKLVAKKMKRPVFFRIPEYLLRLAYLDGATVLCEGQNVVPERLLAEGFTFRYDTLDKCIEHIIKVQRD